jgi:hypothetical protein
MTDELNSKRLSVIKVLKNTNHWRIKIKKERFVR